MCGEGLRCSPIHPPSSEEAGVLGRQGCQQTGRWMALSVNESGLLAFPLLVASRREPYTGLASGFRLSTAVLCQPPYTRHSRGRHSGPFKHFSGTPDPKMGKWTLSTMTPHVSGTSPSCPALCSHKTEMGSGRGSASPQATWHPPPQGVGPAFFFSSSGHREGPVSSN